MHTYLHCVGMYMVHGTCMFYVGTCMVHVCFIGNLYIFVHSLIASPTISHSLSHMSSSVPLMHTFCSPSLMSHFEDEHSSIVHSHCKQNR